MRDDVHAVVVVSVLGEVALDVEVDDEAGLVADGSDRRVLDGRERVGHDREAGDARREPARDVLVVERHLDALVAVLVMHVVNRVEGAHVDGREPAHHGVELVDDVVVVEHVALDRPELRADLRALDLVHAAVDGVEEALGEVRAGAEELHLLADAHGRDAAGDGVVVAVIDAHEVVVLVLDRARGDGHLGAVALEGLREARRPEDREVGLGRRAEVLEGVEVAEAHLGDHGPSVHAHAADGLGHPLGVAREEVVVLGGARELDHAQLHDEVVHELLDLLLRERPAREVPLGIGVEEGARAAEAHGGAVLLLDGGEVAEVGPLDGLGDVRGGARDVAAVDAAELGELAEGADLLGELLAVADVLLGHDRRGAGLLVLLLGDEVVGAVERHATVVADDAAAAVGIGESRDDVRVTAGAHLGGVDVEDARVVGLAVLGVELDDLRVDLVAVVRAGLHRHADAAVDVERALEGLVGLESDDPLEGLVDVSRGMACDRGDDLRVHVEDAAVLALLLEEAHDLAPEGVGGTGRLREEGLVAVVGGVVSLDKVADVDLALPVSADEAVPCLVLGTLHARSFRAKSPRAGPTLLWATARVAIST